MAIRFHSIPEHQFKAMSAQSSMVPLHLIPAYYHLQDFRSAFVTNPILILVPTNKAFRIATVDKFPVAFLCARINGLWEMVLLFFQASFIPNKYKVGHYCSVARVILVGFSTI